MPLTHKFQVKHYCQWTKLRRLLRVLWWYWNHSESSSTRKYKWSTSHSQWSKDRSSTWEWHLHGDLVGWFKLHCNSSSLVDWDCPWSRLGNCKKAVHFERIQDYPKIKWLSLLRESKWRREWSWSGKVLWLVESKDVDLHWCISFAL